MGFWISSSRLTVKQLQASGEANDWLYDSAWMIVWILGFHAIHHGGKLNIIEKTKQRQGEYSNNIMTKTI